MSEDDSPDPSTFYGRTKLVGELFARERGAVALRLSLVFGPHDSGNVALLARHVRRWGGVVLGDGQNRKALVYAGHVARTMGLPIERLVLATNENDVLDEFFRTGIYAPRSSSAVQATSSPSMDISKASNFERFVYDSVGGDAAVTRELYARLGTDGRFDLSSPEQRRLVSDSGLASGTSSHADRMSTIREVSERTGRVVDTHTADGIKVARHFAALSPDIPMICLETALPAKFADSIVEALGHQPRRPAAYEGLENREQRVLVIDNDVDAVRRFIAELSPS